MTKKKAAPVVSRATVASKAAPKTAAKAPAKAVSPTAAKAVPAKAASHTPAKAVSHANAKPPAKTAPPAGPPPGMLQMKSWALAMKLFGERRFADACAAFKEASRGPNFQVADKARSYAQICERKMSGPEPQLKTAEDHFNYGVERLNARDLDRARTHLERARDLDPDGDHILYTLALCNGLSGDGNGACENLKRAIALEPRNRIMARQDAEFALLAGQFPSLRSLLGNGGY
jgi:tetratricopeptide (TPR) repeat protein